MAEKPDDSRAAKQEIRKRAHANRRRQENKDLLSREIHRRLAALPEFKAAGTVMFYVDVRHEVRTQSLLPSVWQQGKRIVVPYCVGDRLELFLLHDVDELAVDTFGILEPQHELRGRLDRKLEVSAIDLIVVPGVAFDRRGGRVGHGRAYYDKLLNRVRPDTTLAALAFECQLFPAVPVESHDVAMDVVITEEAVYRCARPANDTSSGS